MFKGVSAAPRTLPTRRRYDLAEQLRRAERRGLRAAPWRSAGLEGDGNRGTLAAAACLTGLLSLRQDAELAALQRAPLPRSHRTGMEPAASARLDLGKLPNLLRCLLDPCRPLGAGSSLSHYCPI